MGLLRKVWEKIRFEIHMYKIDKEWRLFGGRCFGGYPPSFFHRHTPEEAKRIMNEDYEEIKKIINEYKKE